MTYIVLTHTTAFLGVAILVAIIARRVRLPYTVGLVVAGIGLAATGLETGAMLSVSAMPTLAAFGVGYTNA
ncbi:MAG: hypothetical protein WBW08_09625 [Methyloceanibacter sp.]